MKKMWIAAGLIGVFGLGTFVSPQLTLAKTDSSFSQKNNGSSRMEIMGEGSMMQDSGMMSMMSNGSQMGEMMKSGTRSSITDMMSQMPDLMKGLYTEAAKILGISESELQSQLNKGKSLQDLAQEKGIKGQNLVNNLRKVINAERNSNQKANGKEVGQYEKALNLMSQNIDKMVTMKSMFACNGLN